MNRLLKGWRQTKRGEQFDASLIQCRMILEESRVSNAA
jgi:hypothetical protein